MRTLSYTDLPLTNDPRQVFTVDVTIDGTALHARAELRYLSAPDQWVISIRDHETGEEMVRMVPLICSYGKVNDLLVPFRFLRDGKGIGSLFVLKNTDVPDTEDPAEKTMGQFLILWGDTFDEGKV